MIGMKKAVIIASIIVCMLAVGFALIIRQNPRPWRAFVDHVNANTSAAIELFVDGKKVSIDGTPVQFSIDGGPISTHVLKNGSFSAKKHDYGLYDLEFSINPALWGDSGKPVNFSVNEFITYNKENVHFNIQIFIEPGTPKTAELVVPDRWDAKVTSGKIPIDLKSGTEVSVRVPSP